MVFQVNVGQRTVPGKAPSSPDRYHGVALGVECAWPMYAFSGLLYMQPRHQRSGGEISRIAFAISLLMTRRAVLCAATSA